MADQDEEVIDPDLGEGEGDAGEGDAGEAGAGEAGAGESEVDLPAGYVALVEDGKEEEANRIYGKELGIVEEEPEAEAEVTSEDDEFAFDQLQIDLEEQQGEADAQIAILAAQKDSHNQFYIQKSNRMNAITEEQAALEVTLDDSDLPRDEGRELRARNRSLDREYAKLESECKGHSDQYYALLNEKIAPLAAKKAELQAKQNALKTVDRLAKYPIIGQNRAIAAQLMIEGKITRTTPLKDMASAIAAERVKQGKKPVGSAKSSAGARSGAGAGKPSSKAQEAYKRLMARLPARVGGARGAAPVRRKKSAIPQSLRNADPDSVAMLDEIDAELAERDKKRKEGKK